jgi:hypothetical protein
MRPPATEKLISGLPFQDTPGIVDASYVLPFASEIFICLNPL